MDNQHVDYGALLRRRGFRMTPQREIILAAIGEGHGHTAFDQIFARVQARSPAMNRATIYRTLEFLEELDLVRHPVVEVGVARWHGASEVAHSHLVCRRCGWEQELELSLLEPLDHELRRRYGFTTDLAHFALIGVCSTCREAADSGS